MLHHYKREIEPFQKDQGMGNRRTEEAQFGRGEAVMA